MRGVAVDTIKEVSITSLKPYDDSMWDHNSMYDRMPYIWDPDLNVEKIFRIVSGNVIKSYRCKLKDTYKVKHE